MSNLGCFEDGTHLVAALGPLNVNEIYSHLPEGTLPEHQHRSDVLDSLSLLPYATLQDLKDVADNKTALLEGDDQPFYATDVSHENKETCRTEFMDSIQRDNFKTSICMVCGRERFHTDLADVSLAAYEYEEILKPSVYVPEQELVGNMVLTPTVASYESECAEGPCCCECRDHLNRRQVPPFALCNGLWVGAVPEELQRLGLLERLLVARVLTIAYEVHITARSEHRFSNALTVYPLDPSHCLDNVLPRTMPLDIEQLARFIIVIMTGVSGRDFRGRPVSLTVRRDIVRLALKWLKENNTLYKGILIDENRLTLLPENGVPDAIRSRIRICSSETYHNVTREPKVIQSVKWPANDHEAEYFVCGPHSSEAHRLLLQFPVIFPYGKGGLSRPGFKGMTFPSLAKWCIEYGDKRFRKHHAFVRCLLWEVQEYQIRELVRNHAETSDMIKLPFPGAKLDSIQIDRAITGTNMDDSPYIKKLENVVRGLKEHIPGIRPVLESHDAELFGMSLSNNPPNLIVTIHPWQHFEHIGHFMANSTQNRDRTLYECGFNTTHVHDALVIADPYIPIRLFDKMVEHMMKKLMGRWSIDGELWKRESGGIFGKLKAYLGFVRPTPGGDAKSTDRLQLFLWLEGNPTGAAMEGLLRNYSFRHKLGQYIGHNITGHLEGQIGHYGEHMLAQRTKESIPPDLMATSGIRSKVAWLDEDGCWGPKRSTDNYLPWLPALMPLHHYVELMTNGPTTSYNPRSRLRHFHTTDVPSRQDDLHVLRGLLVNGSLANLSFAETSIAWVTMLTKAYRQPTSLCIRALIESERPISSHRFQDINWNYLCEHLRIQLGRPAETRPENTNWFFEQESMQEYIAYSQRDAQWESFSYYDFVMKTEKVAFYGPRTASIRIEQSRWIDAAPRFRGTRYPRKDADEELFSIFTLGLFKPWRSINTLCEESETPAEALTKYTSTCADATKQLIENLPPYVSLSDNIAN